MKKLLFIISLLTAQIAFGQQKYVIKVQGVSGSGGADSITPNLYAGLGYSDTKKIQLALDLARSKNQKLVIADNYERGSSLWMIDSAILLNSNEYIIIRNATIKLSDSARDNIFRTANCGVGITNAASNPVSNITMEGIGSAVIQGADNPRSSGSKNMTLTLTPAANNYTNSYGTDAGKAGQSQKGDWRNNAIQFAYCDHIKFIGITIKNAGAYGVTFSRCSDIIVENIKLDMPGYAGGDTTRLTYNNGGIDFNQSINNIYVNNVTGISQDDNVAFNIINVANYAGSLSAYYPTGDSTNSATDSTNNITVTNLNAKTMTNSIRLMLPTNFTASNATFSNITNLINLSDPLYYRFGTANASGITIGYGAASGNYGSQQNKVGTIYNFNINNVTSNYTQYGINLKTSLSESSISNVQKKYYPTVSSVYSAAPLDSLRNVYIIDAYPYFAPTTTSASTVTINAVTTKLYTVTALATGITFANPTGTPNGGDPLTIRIKDNGTSQTISFGSQFRGGTDVPLPTATTISKTMYLEFEYNVTDSKWDLIRKVDGI